LLVLCILYQYSAKIEIYNMPDLEITISTCEEMLRNEVKKVGGGMKH
jgi:hypothetical protein